MKKQILVKLIFASIIATVFIIAGFAFSDEKEENKPNIVILMSDNHSWSHLGCYGDPVVKTPNIDKIAQQGIRFTNAFCAAPSCTPARASMLTGQNIWRLEEGANLWGILPSKFKVYTEMLEEAGYLVGFEGKGWGPGSFEAGGRDRNPAGEQFSSLEEFISKRKEGQPFTYWFSSRNPHRPYNANAKEQPVDLASIEVPTYLPDNDAVRRDIADYYAEVQMFDKEVGAFMKYLEESGAIENTIVIVCSDNGWQMPRGLANLYKFGTKVPMIIKMPGKDQKGRVINDFVSLNDLAPTFLELAGLPIPDEMDAKSLVNILNSNKSGVIDPARDFMVTARERHAFVRQDGAGYGGRAIITDNFLYIRNFEPEQWPAGDPPLFGDVDAHMLHYPSPTKMYILKNREKEDVRKFFELAFAKRPAEELYDLVADPDQMNNVAHEKAYKEIKNKLAERLNLYLEKSNDPRVIGGELKWIGAEYFAERDKRPVVGKSAQQELGLKEQYKYVD